MACGWLSETQAFHANAQYDTLIASQIALASQRDGQTTKGISILGMLFLPGTYISVRPLREDTRYSRLVLTINRHSSA
jgi:hypothetical protein